jgi:hypothetical protein
MKNILIALSLLSILLTGCEIREKPQDTEEASQVDLSSDAEVPQMLEASFMSANQTFAFTLNYDGNMMQLMDSALSAAVSNIDPNFKVSNGATLVGFTAWASEVEMVPELSAAKLYGHYQVYRMSFPDGICTVDQAVVPHLEEALVLRVKTCPDQDSAVSLDALESLLNGLQIKDL